MTMANTKKSDLYDTPGVDVDFDPEPKVGAKDSFWNRQVRLCKDQPGTVPEDYNPDENGPAGPGDVRKGWKFYPGAQTKANDLPKRFPGIERRTGVHQGKEGLFLRYNPLLAAQIERTAKTNDVPDTSDTPTAVVDSAGRIVHATDGETKTGDGS